MTSIRGSGRALAALLVSGALVVGGLAAAAPAHAATPLLTLSPSAGPAGAQVAVTGAGFPRKSSGTISGGSTITSFTASASGSFRVTITIPAAATGRVPVTATAGTATASASFAVTVPAAGPPPISTARLQFGVATPGGAAANGELDAVAALVGESPGIVMSYYDFGQPAPISGLDSVAARGATSMLTWEPWRWGGGVSQSAFTNTRVAAGDHDAYLRQWGSALAAWGKPVYLRYAHEMNGDWYPWAEGANSNAPGSFVAAWRHVHGVLRAQGATNVRWVWSPNVPYPGSGPLASLYPGAAYVDVVALDGYNWGTSQSWSSWASPPVLFGDGLAQLRSIAPGKPIMIAETASSESGGSKAQWNTELVSYLHQQSDVVAVVWFHFDKEVDWRIDSTSASASALASALAARRS